MNDTETIRSLTTLVAVVLGFILGQIAEWLRSRKSGRKLIETTQTLVALELARNHSMLIDYWRRVASAYDPCHAENGVLNYIKVARAVIKFPFPPIGKNVWLASFNKLPLAYSPETLTELWSSYEAFEQLQMLYEQLESLERNSEDAGRYSESKGDWPTGILSQLVGSAHFSNRAEHLAQQFEIQMRCALGSLFIELPSKTT